MTDLALANDEESGELTPSESARLYRLELVIEEGLEKFLQVGGALMEIQKAHLYRETFGTFEDYCRERWGMSRGHAYRLLDAAAVQAALSPTGDTLDNESQARELAPLLREDEAQAVETWRELRERHGEKLTAEKVRQAVDERLGRDHTLNVMGSSASEDWPTPQDLFDELHREFGFKLDVCATETNAKCARFYTPDMDGLSQLWDGVCWMNPPYGAEISKWVQKAWSAAQEGATVVVLVPARVDAGWWWEYALHGEIRFLRGRLKTGKQSWPFPSAVIVFGRPAGVVWWERDGRAA